MREQPQVTKTIIIHGLRDEHHQNEIKGKVEKMFDTKEVYMVQNHHKVLCVMFYDERKAEEAISYLLETEGLQSCHTISKYEIPRDSERCDELKNQSTLLFTFKNLVGSVNERMFSELVCKFGEVKDIRPVKNIQKCVEFYDSRYAVMAFQNTNEAAFGDSIMQVKFVWDLSIKTRWQMIKHTDEILKECKLDIKPLMKKECEDATEDQKRRKATDTHASTSPKNFFLQQFDAFIVKNIDLIDDVYVCD